MVQPKSLEELDEDPYLEVLGDRRKSPDRAFKRLIRDNRTSLEERSFNDVYEDGEIVGTELDVFTLGRVLTNTGARIEVDSYERSTPKHYERESPDNRRGRVWGVVTNKKHHAISFLIGEEEVKGPRNLMIVDPRGDFYGGISGITVREQDRPRVREALEPHGLPFEDGSVRMRYPVPPNWRTLIPTRRYVRLMAADQRLKDTYRAHSKLGMWIRKNVGVDLTYQERKSSGVAPGFHYVEEDLEWIVDDHTESEKVESIETRLGGWRVDEQYPVIAMDESGGVEIIHSSEESFFASENFGKLGEEDWRNVLRWCESRKNLTHSMEAKYLRAQKRGIDLAFYKYGFRGERAMGNERDFPWELPPWQDIESNNVSWRFMQLGKSTFVTYRLRERAVQVVEGAFDHEPRSTQDLYT